jgi:hypothetical protein
MAATMQGASFVFSLLNSKSLGTILYRPRSLQVPRAAKPFWRDLLKDFSCDGTRLRGVGVM